ncbi:hypothetical protein R3I94_020708 [Phoxinus phoxinus]
MQSPLKLKHYRRTFCQILV